MNPVKLTSINILEKTATYLMMSDDDYYNNINPNDLTQTQTFDLDCEMGVQSIVNFLDKNYKWSNSFWAIVEEPFKKELQDAILAEGLRLFNSEKYNLQNYTMSKGFGFMTTYKLSENDRLFAESIDSLIESELVTELVESEPTYLEMSFSERSGFETESNRYIYFIDGNIVNPLSYTIPISELQSLLDKGFVIYNTKNNFFITQKTIKTMQTLDVSLTNADLYKGCEIEEVAGRLNLTTPISEAVNIVGRNVAAMDLKGDEITLTGAMAVWSYLIVFHAVVHRFRRVYYDDGRNATILVAAHG